MGGGGGQRRRKSDLDGSTGKWGEVVRTQEMRKPRMNERGAKNRKCRKDERSKRKTKQGVSKHIKQDKEHMEGRKQKRDEQGRM